MLDCIHRLMFIFFFPFLTYFFLLLHSVLFQIVRNRFFSVGKYEYMVEESNSITVTVN